MTYKTTFNNIVNMRWRNMCRLHQDTLEYQGRKQVCTRHLTDSILTYCIVLNILVTTVHIVHTKGLLQYCFKSESMTDLVQDYQWILINNKG